MVTLFVILSLVGLSVTVRVTIPGLGELEGNVVALNNQPNTHVRSFLGVPYAKPPVDNLRFEVTAFSYIYSLNNVY